MSGLWQWILTGLCVLAAAIYLARLSWQYYRRLTDARVGACGGCATCDSDRDGEGGKGDGARSRKGSSHGDRGGRQVFVPLESVGADQRLKKK